MVGIGLGCTKLSAGHFVLNLPHAPDAAALVVVEMPAAIGNVVGKRVERVSCSPEGDAWNVLLDELEVDYDPISGLPVVLGGRPHDSGFEFMLLRARLAFLEIARAEAARERDETAAMAFGAGEAHAAAVVAEWVERCTMAARILETFGDIRGAAALRALRGETR